MPLAKAGKKRRREDEASVAARPEHSVKGEKRRDEVDADVAPHPKNRATQDDDADSGHWLDGGSLTRSNDPRETSGRISNVDQEAFDQILPAEVQRLTDRYHFSTMSILSSSKIESRVRNLLAKTDTFSFAKANGKPEVVILSATAKVANKLGSIVEITKNQIQSDKGTWWQYSKLHGELRDLQQKRAKRTGGGKTLGELDEERRQNDAAGEKVADGAHEISTEELKDQAPVNQDESDDPDDDFETIANPRMRGSMTNSGNTDAEKVRNTPIMTIFFARVPVPGLKELYG